MYSKSTKNIRVTVEPIFNDRLSIEEESKYIWDYNISIENLSNTTIQLLERFWKITDSMGNVTNISGEGVIGTKPIIKNGSCFTYSSYTVIKTSSGFMEGFYLVKTENGNFFEIAIPVFSLDEPSEEKLLM
jgi:ApaG protein